MMRSMHLLAVAVCLTLPSSSAISASAALSDDAVGVVAAYRPAASRFEIQRAGVEPVPVRIGTVVAAGDRLTLPAGAAVIVQQGGGQRREYAGPGSFEIPAAESLGKLASVFRSISTVFDDEYRLAGTAASRGGEDCRDGVAGVREIEVPILSGSPAIAAGKRDLPLAWIGGCTPFRVSVQAAEGGILARKSVEGRQVRLDGLPLALGQYVVVIEDASGLTYRGAVEVVESAPAIPPDLAGDSIPLGIVAGALWLADHENGRWRFDSFERLRPLIRAGDPMAGAIGDGVLWGRYEP